VRAAVINDALNTRAKLLDVLDHEVCTPDLWLSGLMPTWMVPPRDVANAAQVSTISFHSPGDRFHSTVSPSGGTRIVTLSFMEMHPSYRIAH
jgi:hypothetical protein